MDTMEEAVMNDLYYSGYIWGNMLYIY